MNPALLSRTTVEQIQKQPARTWPRPASPSFACSVLAQARSARQTKNRFQARCQRHRSKQLVDAEITTAPSHRRYAIARSHQHRIIPPVMNQRRGWQFNGIGRACGRCAVERFCPLQRPNEACVAQEIFAKKNLLACNLFSRRLRRRKVTTLASDQRQTKQQLRPHRHPAPSTTRASLRMPPHALVTPRCTFAAGSVALRPIARPHQMRHTTKRPSAVHPARRAGRRHIAVANGAHFFEAAAACAVVVVGRHRQLGSRRKEEQSPHATSAPRPPLQCPLNNSAIVRRNH